MSYTSRVLHCCPKTVIKTNTCSRIPAYQQRPERQLGEAAKASDAGHRTPLSRLRYPTFRNLQNPASRIQLCTFRSRSSYLPISYKKDQTPKSLSYTVGSKDLEVYKSQLRDYLFSSIALTWTNAAKAEYNKERPDRGNLEKSFSSTASALYRHTQNANGSLGNYRRRRGGNTPRRQEMGTHKDYPNASPYYIQEEAYIIGPKALRCSNKNTIP